MAMNIFVYHALWKDNKFFYFAQRYKKTTHYNFSKWLNIGVCSVILNGQWSHYCIVDLLKLVSN